MLVNKRESKQEILNNIKYNKFKWVQIQKIAIFKLKKKIILPSGILEILSDINKCVCLSFSSEFILRN